MPNIVEFPAFTLKKGVSVSEFLPVAERFHREFIAKQKGYISHKLLVSGDKWYDLVTWESMEETENAFKAIYQNAAATEYIALIEQIGTDEEIPLFSVVKDYQDIPESL